MRTVDRIVMNAAMDACWRAAADVERWPELLPHYRWVRFLRHDGFATGRVEMAARRPFGPLDYPVWWVSEMKVDEAAPAVIYRHVEGVTTGMDVVWSFEPLGPAQTRVSIVHEWDDGPAWPLPLTLRRKIANTIIGPVFIQHVASRTLRGLRDEAEAPTSHPGTVRR